MESLDIKVDPTSEEQDLSLMSLEEENSRISPSRDVSTQAPDSSWVLHVDGRQTNSLPHIPVHSIKSAMVESQFGSIVPAYNNSHYSFSDDGYLSRKPLGEHPKLNNKTFTKQDSLIRAYIRDPLHPRQQVPVTSTAGNLWTNAILGMSGSPTPHYGAVPDIRPVWPLHTNVSLGGARPIPDVVKIDGKSDSVASSDMDSSVFSISGRRVVVSPSAHKEKKGDQLLDNQEPQPKIQNRAQSRRGILAPSAEKKRHCLQLCTDSCSLFLFIPGTILCMLSPWLLVPLYVIPSFFAESYDTIIWVCSAGSIVILCLGCIVGNIVWYRKTDRWRCVLHCGSGPTDHYWGDSFFKKKRRRTPTEVV